VQNFADRQIAAIEKKGTPACVGLDPRFELIPREIRDYARESKSPAVQAECLFTFSREVLDVVEPHVGVVKPQVAFYERLGVAGLAAYAATVQTARWKGLIVIGDVKRGDIGSTAEAYAASHLKDLEEDEEGGSLTADAITVNPYLGTDSIEPFVAMAREKGRGIYVLVKTSNPSAAEFQDLKVDGTELFVKVAEKVNDWGRELVGERGYSSVGAVVGATYPEQAARLRKIMPRAYLLVPGYGAQGATAEDVGVCFNDDGLGAVVNSSRGIIYAWTRPPYKEQYGEGRWREAIEAATKDMINELRQVAVAT